MIRAWTARERTTRLKSARAHYASTSGKKLRKQQLQAIDRGRVRARAKKKDGSSNPLDEPGVEPRRARLWAREASEEDVDIVIVSEPNKNWNKLAARSKFRAT